MAKNLIRNHGDWYCGSVVLKLNFTMTDKKPIFWENTYIVRSSTYKGAFAKLVSLGQGDCGSTTSIFEGAEGRWEFVGITDLVSICEDIQDGAEILWTDHGVKDEQEMAKRILSFEDLCRIHNLP